MYSPPSSPPHGRRCPPGRRHSPRSDPPPYGPYPPPSPFHPPSTIRCLRNDEPSTVINANINITAQATAEEIASKTTARQTHSNDHNTPRQQHQPQGCGVLLLSLMSANISSGRNAHCWGLGFVFNQQGRMSPEIIHYDIAPSARMGGRRNHILCISFSKTNRLRRAADRNTICDACNREGCSPTTSPWTSALQPAVSHSHRPICELPPWAQVTRVATDANRDKWAPSTQTRAPPDGTSESGRKFSLRARQHSTCYIPLSRLKLFGTWPFAASTRKSLPLASVAVALHNRQTFLVSRDLIITRARL